MDRELHTNKAHVGIPCSEGGGGDARACMWIRTQRKRISIFNMNVFEQKVREWSELPWITCIIFNPIDVKGTNNNQSLKYFTARQPPGIDLNMVYLSFQDLEKYDFEISSGIL